jgi:hypothetical protein
MIVTRSAGSGPHWPELALGGTYVARAECHQIYPFLDLFSVTRYIYT